MQRNATGRQAIQCGMIMKRKCIMSLENREETTMRLRKNLIQGIEALMLAMLCHWTNADGAAVIMLMVSVGLLFGKSKRRV